MKCKRLYSNFKGRCFLSRKLPNKESYRRLQNSREQSRNRRKESELKERWTIIIWNQKRAKGKTPKQTKGEFYSWRINKKEIAKIRGKMSRILITKNSLRKNLKLQANAISHKRELFPIYDFKPLMI